jgi:hypothetical protein
MPFRILSFCGGGIRGMASATMLNELCKACAGIDIVKGADMLAGTSTGSGITAWLVNPHDTKPHPVQRLVDYFWTDEVAFFSVKSKKASEPAYDVQAFAKSMQKKYQTTTLNAIPQKLLITSFNVGETIIKNGLPAAGVPWGPVLFNNFPGSKNGDTELAHAVVCSSAMPGMFGGYNGFVDGAFVNHDPTLAAIALAVNAGIPLTDIVAICFGTGFMANSIGPVINTTNNATTLHHPGWGAEQWLHGLPDSSYCLQSLLINENGISPIVNISLNGTSTNLIPHLSGMMLAQPQGLPSTRYAYLNPKLDQFIPENDTNLENLKYLQDQAKGVTSTDEFSQAKTLVQKYWSSPAATTQ